MNRANVIGPSRSISARIRATSASSWPTASRSGTGSRRRPGVTSIAHRRGGPSTTSRTPGPTSVWPPSRIGIGAAAADTVSSRSHGSATASASSRSEAKRSSADGQPASSAPSRCASRTRLSTIAASAKRARCVAERPRAVAVEEEPEDRGRRRPGAATGGPPRSGRADRSPGPGATLPEGRAPRPRRGRAPRRGARASRASRQTFARRRAAPPADRSRPRGRRPVDLRPPRSPRRRHVSSAGRQPEQDQVERTVEIEPEPPAPPQVIDPVAGDLLEPAWQRVVAGQIRDRRAASRPARSPRRPPSSGCWRAPPGRRRRRPRRTLGGRPPSPAGSRPSRGRPARRTVAPSSKPRSRSPNERSSGGPDTISTSVAPAARNPRRWRSATRTVPRRAGGSADRRRGPARGAGSGRRRVASAESRRRPRPARRPARRERRYWGRATANGPCLHRPRGEPGRGGGDARARRSTPSPRSPAPACAVSRGCTRPNRSASPTSRSSATRSPRSTSRPARTPATGALALLASLKALERSFGRVARARWGPRELDLDLLVFGRARLVGRSAAGALVRSTRTTDPAKAVEAARGPASGGGSTPLRPRAAGRPRPAASCRRAGTSRSRPLAAARRRSRGRRAVRPVGTWDPALGAWRPDQPR